MLTRLNYLFLNNYLLDNYRFLDDFLDNFFNWFLDYNLFYFLDYHLHGFLDNYLLLNHASRYLLFDQDRNLNVCCARSRRDQQFSQLRLINQFDAFL